LKHRIWYLAAAAAAALHGAAWLALTFEWAPFAPERMRFSMVEAELAQAPAPAVQRAAPDPSPKQEPRPQKTESKPQPRAEQSARPAPEEPEGNSRPAASPPPSAPAESRSGPAGEAFSEPVFSAAYLNNPPPPYPIVARRRGIAGVVLLRAEVSAEGRCLQAKVMKSSGFGPLDEAALEAVKKWRFAPAKRGGQSVSAWVEIPVNFKLEGEG